MGTGERTSGRTRPSRLVALFFALVAIALFLPSVPAVSAAPAANWGEQFPTQSPAARESGAMAFDSMNQEMVLFGGQTEAGVRLNDTWTWNGKDWTEESPAHSPPPRFGARLAFDPNSEQLILVGGQTSNGITGETWTWDGSDWTELFPATPAPAVALPSVATDPATDNVVLFGGSSAGTGTYRNWTWSWNGSTWTQLDPASSPPARFGASMAYDNANELLVLFSGTGDQVAYDDTWTWNGSTWTRMFPSESPPFIGAGSMAFSPATDSLIHLGGGPAVPDATAPTWSWDGSEWSQVATFASPPSRFSAEMQLDEASGKVLLFGGNGVEGVLGDTWTFGIQTDQAPTATISSPANGGVYELGETGRVTFSCSAAQGGPPVATCIGSDGSDSATGGRLDTSSLGSHTYSVTATAVDGQTGSASISYRVIRKSPPKPVCHGVPGGLTLRTFQLRPPFGDARQVPGFRVRLSATRRVDARISPRIVYSTRAGRRSFQYRARTVRVDRVRKLRFELPARVERQLLRSQGVVFGTRVTFRLRARLKARGDRSSCFERAENLAYELPVVAVSGRVALRRR